MKKVEILKAGIICVKSSDRRVFSKYIIITFSCLNTVKIILAKTVREYDQEIPQSQTADIPMAPRGRVTQPSRDTRKTN